MSAPRRAWQDEQGDIWVESNTPGVVLLIDKAMTRRIEEKTGEGVALADATELYRLVPLLPAPEPQEPQELEAVAAVHQCSWQVLGAQAQVLLFAKLEVTQVLQRCDVCGALQTVQLNGSWSADQVRGCVQ